ncbi:MAG: RNA 2'-phosphotransferase [Candidatus Hadarchaeum sp.]|uniref:RNA 2'-phosphotransferase n=1 Tax=Candidatus Hadarchaeum sp. TaxID=2883567 RepID=UPI003D0BCE6A
MDQEFTFLDEKQRERLSRLMAFHLRHDATIERTPEGYVSVQKLADVIRRKINWVKPHHIREVALFDTKGRYELNGQLIRARYGHSVDVKLDYPEADVDVLYYAVAPDSVPQVTAAGLKPQVRKMVHLSPRVDWALEAGRIRAENPVVLAVDVRRAKQRGIKILKASDRVYLAPEIPPECIKVLEKGSG